MEIFGIVLSIPGAFVLSTIYCFVLKRVISRFEQVNLSFRVGSYIVLALIGLEVVFLMTWGAVRSRGIFGPGFYGVHLLCFFLGTPALANLLVLRRRGGSIAKWYLAPILCTAFAFSLVLLQYGVAEALYGINGDDGPYSGQHGTSNPRRQFVETTTVILKMSPDRPVSLAPPV
jgi:hypothetical protein